MLMSAGLPLFKQIDVHGYWLSGESKMSKSLGNVVRPGSFDEQFGIENLRYYFFREMKFGGDSSFTYELFVERYNSDLANGLGNLLSRVSSIIKKNLNGTVPKSDALGEAEKEIVARAAELEKTYPRHFEGRQFHLAVEEIRGLLAATDRYINDTQPWRLAKEEGKEADLRRVLYTGLEVVRIATLLLSPMMPKTCKKILTYLGEERPLDGAVPFSELLTWGGLKDGHALGKVPRAFPRIDDKKLKTVLDEAEKEAAIARREAGMSSAEKGDVDPIGPEITIDDFSKIDLRVGIIREAGLVEGAKKLIRLMVDLGEGKHRQVFAGIRSAYPEPEKLIGQEVIVVANLKPRKMKFGVSEGMVLAGGGGTNRLCVATFDRDLVPGDTVA
jgi:methionyl-tRNA synthetase